MIEKPTLRVFLFLYSVLRWWSMGIQMTTLNSCRLRMKREMICCSAKPNWLLLKAKFKFWNCCLRGERTWETLVQIDCVTSSSSSYLVMFTATLSCTVIREDESLCRWLVVIVEKYQKKIRSARCPDSVRQNNLNNIKNVCVMALNFQVRCMNMGQLAG